MKKLIGLKFLLILLVLNGCKGCKEDVKPGPCSGSRTINTSFVVKVGNRGFQPPGDWCTLVSCDTFNETSVIFNAPDGNPIESKYEWKIGTSNEKRLGSGFEISFSDYLEMGNWEKPLSITLTIKTPKSYCLTNMADTLISVTRNIFFTNRFLSLIEPNNPKVSYRGNANGDTESEVIISIIKKTTGSFRGAVASTEFPLILYVGTSHGDTLLRPSGNCGSEGCRSYNHAIALFHNQDLCSEGNLTNHMFRSETLFLAREQRVHLIFEFWKKDASPERYEFVGNKI
jgi:hypothetical protein